MKVKMMMTVMVTIKRRALFRPNLNRENHSASIFLRITFPQTLKKTS